ncbi:MAG: protein kinase [Gallionellaceae bacterium]
MIKYLGRYEILEEIGRGAMGIVYMAKDPLIQRNVAIKTINLQDLLPDEREEYEISFYQEARAAGRLSHTNIVTIYDLGESEGMAYIAMELLQGKELEQVLKSQQHLPLEITLEIAIQVAGGLAHAHEHGIIHRDIKPSNIMLLENRRVKIADFGIAKMASTKLDNTEGKLVGSPLHMSPEQVLNSPIDSRSDIFSLGIVLYQMITGKPPFYGESINAVIYQIVNENPPQLSVLNPEVTPMLSDIVAKCLAKNADERYQNANELADNLRLCRGKLLHDQAGLNRLNKLRPKQNSSQRFDVLLVEDDPHIGELFQIALEKRGHFVKRLVDGESAWESYQSQSFPLLIVDWQLAGMDGLELCRKVRASPKGANTLVLMLTARTSPDDLEQVMAAGADDYLAKPVDFDLLNIRLSISEQRVIRLKHDKEVEAALRIAAVAFESQESLMITDAKCVILRVNKAFTEKTGYMPDEVVGRTPRLFSSGCHVEGFYRSMWETIHRTGQWQGEILDRHKNGTIYSQWLSISAVKGGDGIVTHYVGSHIDISKYKAKRVE